MRRLLAVAMIATISLGAAVSSSAAPVQPTVRQLERTVEWQKHRIHNLEARRAYLHRYIRHMRARHRQPVVTTHTSSYSGGVLTDAQVASYLRGAGFPESAIPTMLYYSHRESGNNPRAVNSFSGACGLWQLYPCYGGERWLDPAVNAHFAHEKYLASGFSPWGN